MSRFQEFVKRALDEEAKYLDLPKESQDLYVQAEKLAATFDEMGKSAQLGWLKSSPLLRSLIGAGESPGLLSRLKTLVLGSPEARIAEKRLAAELARLETEAAASQAISQSFREAGPPIVPEIIGKGPFGLSPGELAVIGAGTTVPALAIVMAPRSPKVEVIER